MTFKKRFKSPDNESCRNQRHKQEFIYNSHINIKEDINN